MDFDRLAARHKDAVYRQMLRVCGNQEDAEDALVEALLRAYRSMDQLKSEEAFRSWLGMIGKRVCIRMRRRDDLAEVIALGEFEPAAPDRPDADAARKELRNCVGGVISSLPAIYRETYVLREIEGLSGEETSARLGISLAAQKSRLNRARALVREGLDRSFCLAD